ncbi:virion structural protein [Staphylococcus phage Twort]|uniref:ORF106 n=1 Tax=Staphylococcus phage Twort (strain DSM 17442 / HER 48) TaxID=2908167 RepID=Q4Z9F0_BPTWO|nr:virion structural protein [Staphylococcus phage Twort]AAX92399.1 ORF106 [Staphylococcus phage Twort]
MASQAKQTVHTGNTVMLMIKGKPVGRAQSASGTRSYGTEGVYEIGSIMPQEHVYLKYEGELTVERLRMKKENFAKLGYASLGEEILKKDIIDIVVIDNLTKEVLVSYHGCSANNYELRSFT